MDLQTETNNKILAHTEYLKPEPQVYRLFYNLKFHISLRGLRRGSFMKEKAQCILKLCSIFQFPILLSPPTKNGTKLVPFINRKREREMGDREVSEILTLG
jgi:hypothetical protein